MDENRDEKKPNLGVRFAKAFHARELAAARWVWHEIKGRADAERAVDIGQQAAFYAILVRIVFVLFQPALEDRPEIDYSLLFEPWMLVMLFVYGFVYFQGYRRWWILLITMAVFTVDSIVLPRETGGGTVAQALIALYVLRCFFVGVRGARWIEADDARLDSRMDSP